MKADLLLCPCCGGIASFHDYETADGRVGWHVTCENARCGIATPLKFGDEAIEQLQEIWNRRVLPV